LAGQFNWWFILASQTPVTVFVIVKEICSDRYHGCFARGHDSRAVVTPRLHSDQASGA